MKTALLKKRCVPCEAGTPPLKGGQIRKYAREIHGWKIVRKKMLLKEFKFKNFRESMDFVRKVAVIAEREGHHPDIYIFYNIVRLKLWTHAIGGLSTNDFILAAKINAMQKMRIHANAANVNR